MMLSKTALATTCWAVLWVLLFWVSRANHPTVMLDAVATTLMVMASAAAFAIIVQASRSTSAITKICAVALAIVGGGILAALAIHAVYDIEVGPDPRRFGLMANIGMDTAVVAVSVTLVGAAEWGLRRVGFKSQS
ncbi:MAG TPA: hypothetical protein VKR31_17350 [Rhizomicrobium sp.]|nr:hypothetical protein [Rhizomicrobium sp.]